MNISSVENGGNNSAEKCGSGIIGVSLFPHGRDVFDTAYSLGAYAAYLSGAGPSLMAIVDAENEFFCGKMKFALEKMGLENWQVHELHIDNVGTKIL